MARRTSRTLTELELEIMQVVWEQGEVTVEGLIEAFGKAGRPLAPPSFRTMLGILQDKGYVTRRRTGIGRTYAYRAVVSADQAQKRILKDIVARAFDGSALSLVAALVNTGLVSPRELEKIRRLIRRREREGGK